MHGAGIGNRGAAQRGGHHLTGVGRGDAGIFISRPVGVIHVAHQIGADVLMQVLPLAVLADEVGAIAFPQNVAVLGGAVHLAVLALVSGQAGVDDAGGDEAAAGALAIGGDLDDIGDQRVDGALHQGAGILAGDLGINLHQVKHIFHAHSVVVAHAAVVDLIEAAHTAEGVGPGAVIAAGPDHAPLAGGVGAAVQIGVLGLDVLHLLTGVRIADALMQSQFSHQKLPPSPAPK